MTTRFPSSSQNSAAVNILSPEAKEFVPRQLSDPSPAHEGQAPFDPTGPVGDGLLGPGPLGSPPVDIIPRYMTTCYPFVATSDARLGNHPRLPGKFDNRVFMPQFHAGVRQRFQQPGTNGFTLPPAWNLQPGGVCFGGLPRIPNGMPFDGGTFPNGVRPLGFPQMFHNQSVRPLNGVVDPSRVLVGVEHNEDVCVTEKADSDDASRTVALQTDFPAEIADSSLDDMPNTLFQKNFSTNQTIIVQDTKTKLKNKHSVSKRSHSNADVQSSTQSLMTSSVQGDHVTTLHSGESGTLPKEENRSGSNAYFSGSSESTQYSSSGANVPYLYNNPTGISYASVAQGRPSQTNVNSKNVSSSHVSNNFIYKNSVSMATSDAKNCDTSSKDSVGLKTGNKALYGTINVLDIINDLEKADLKKEESKNEAKNKVEREKVPSDKLNITAQEFRPSVAYQINGEVTSPSQSVVSPVSYGLQHMPPQFPMQGWPWPSKDNIMVNGMKLVPGVGDMSWQPMFPPPVPPVNSQGQIGHIGTISFSDAVRRQPLQTKNFASPVSNATNANSTNAAQGSTTEADGEQKKKKRRRRRRKKKNSESAGDGDNGDGDDACSGANDDVILHFEDEAEFPDLGSMGRSVERPTASVTLSYGDVLKNTQVQSTLSSQDDSCAQLSNTESNPATKETRTSRKRRKRREVANKAADAEMAEINLEQHMLELKMKQKLPLSARKSASPVRNTPSQGVWKLAPSSPVSANPSPLSTGGKKVSLLLPGTVAQEPTYQPNTSIKQPGILKTTSHMVTPPPPVSQVSAGGGKKSKQPIMCDLGALIDAFEVKKVQEQKKEAVKALTPRKEEVKQLNPLDSNAPAVKRGKERETPKAKKPSPLKKVILKEREEKKRMRLLDEEEVNQSAPVGIGVVSGGESDLSQDTSSFNHTEIIGIGTPNSAELSPISQPSPSCMSSLSPGTSPLSSGLTSPMTGTLQQTVKLKIHSRRFREYCNQVLDKEIDTSVTALLQDLVRFQDKQYHKDPIKAKAKRRFVLGLREVTKHLRLKKIKCVIISPNLEKIQSKGGLDDALNNILELCNDQKTPFIFALGRRALGRACAKLVPVSVVGVFNYDGSEENFRNLVSLTEKAREQYREMIHQIEKEIAEHPPRVSIPGVPHIFAHMGHSRTPSGCSVISFTSSILSEPISENYPHSEPETDDRGYEIEKDPDDDELEVDLENVVDGGGDGEGEEGSESENDETGYEADSEVGFDKRRKRFGPRKTGGVGVGVVDYRNMNGVRHDEVGTTVNGGTMVNGLGAAGTVTCRPGILKNSAERLRLMNAGNHGIDTGKGTVITNHVAASGDAGLSCSGDRNDSSQHSESCNIQLSRNIDSGHADDNHLTSNGATTQPPVLENGINDSFVTVTAKLPIVNGDMGDTDSNSTRELDFKTCDEDSDLERQVQMHENQDRLEDLPRFIDSVHNLDLESTLSQYSSKTAETGEIEVLSTHSSKTTHSSRTLGDGGNTEREKSLKTAVFDGRRGRGSSNPSPVNNGPIGGVGSVGKTDRENRTLSWVQETQSLHFSEQVAGPVGGQEGEGEGPGMECVDGGV